MKTISGILIGSLVWTVLMVVREWLIRRTAAKANLLESERMAPLIATENLSPPRVCFSRWEGMSPALIAAQEAMARELSTAAGPKPQELPGQQTPINAVQCTNSEGGLYWLDREGRTYWTPPPSWNGKIPNGAHLQVLTVKCSSTFSSAWTNREEAQRAADFANRTSKSPAP